jgi:NAD(P)-dependent dehydrogenase (short-subunit alcohol dehydrogenase family)|tara:strand:+ start:134 stop:919 length:786 start_codon:yes stop_codon:yes gene_type:complete
MNHQKLLNKNIVISAAADGIGSSIAEYCMNNGATVYLSDINEDKLSLLKDHKNYNKTLFIKKVKANDAKSVLDYSLELKDNISSIDGLINNVGIAGPTGKIEDLEIEEWKNTIDININSHFYFSKFFIPLLKKNGGSIINLSSTAGLFGFPLRTPYAASKWATIGLTKSLAMELGKFNIRVNAICPGSVSGDRMKRVIEAKAQSMSILEKEVQRDFESMTSLNTFVDKEDIANTVIFLLSDDAKRISGQVMTIDGNTERMH